MACVSPGLNLNELQKLILFQYSLRAQNFPRTRLVLPDLLHQRLHVREAALVAQLLNEQNLYLLIVKVAVKVKQMRFNQQIRFRARLGLCNGRPVTDVADRIIRLAIDLRYGGIHSKRRPEFAAEVEVGSMVSQPAAARVTFDDGAVDRNAPPQHGLRVAQAAFTDGFTNARAGDRAAIGAQYRPVSADNNAQLGSKLRQRRRILADAVAAKARIEAHHQAARLQPVHNEKLREIAGVQFGKLGCEIQHPGEAHAQALKQKQTVFERGDEIGRAAFECLARMIAEGDHAGWRGELGAPGVERREHGLVPAVHAIEAPDGEDRGALA